VLNRSYVLTLGERGAARGNYRQEPRNKPLTDAGALTPTATCDLCVGTRRKTAALRRSPNPTEPSPPAPLSQGTHKLRLIANDDSVDSA